VTVRIAMIAAVGANGVIGSGNSIPWRLPSDFAHFKRTTMGKPIIMGRKTYESIGKPLPGRENIVVTRRGDFRPPGVIVRGTLNEAVEHAQAVASETGAEEVMICGGGEIYREAMPIADRLYISHVEASPAGDVSFPTIDPAIWRPVEERETTPDPRDTASYRVNVYERR
jgi:dihydrofolate reductase